MSLYDDYELPSRPNKTKTEQTSTISFLIIPNGTFKNGQWKVRHSVPIYVVDYLVSKVFNWIMIWQLNFSANPPEFAF